MIPVRRALLSVTDKSGLVEFARGLAGLSIEILSTGGTAKTLRDAGLPVTDVAEVTGMNEMLDGRVKTLHPRVHGGILADRDRPGHRADMEREGIVPIDLVAINLYAFEATVARPDVTAAEAIEKIDIGGPAMIRAAAKNHRHVLVVTDPAQYASVLDALREYGGEAPAALGRTLAGEAFRKTAAYDAEITRWFDRESITTPARPPVPFPDRLELRLDKVKDLRYGENPHQPAALYLGSDRSRGIGAARQFSGKEMSFTNYLDLDAALRLLDEFDEPVAVVVKHLNPCGVGFGATIAGAWARALAADPLSAFGGVVGLNRPCDEELAGVLSETFLEIIAAPAFSEAALAVLGKKKALRVIACPDAAAGPAPAGGSEAPRDIRHLKGGYLLQAGNPAGPPAGFEVVTKRQPTDVERDALLKAWRIVKRVKSNAIVIADGTGSIGIGCGATSRIDAVDDAVRKASRGVGLNAGAVLASDAFFPFRDSIDLASRSGIRAVIQPGGSVRDPESIAAADEHGMTMVFTGERAFLH
jgi:phosphoribosylaminoimidazolecarboxamide formyltransferase/IMP cyclohydrolase